MSNISVLHNLLPASSEKAVNNVTKLQNIIKDMPQTDINTLHIIHNNMYARTIKVPAGVLITGALVKIGTILIAQGDVIVYLDDDAIELRGYNVFAASANRKQAVLALTDVYFTMIFPTTAKTIADAENEFTDEVDLLMSRQQQDVNTIIITGE